MTTLEKIDPLTACPKLWTRYLLRLFQCELKDLNAQLTLQIEPGEKFKFGVCPKPSPSRTAAKVFDRVHNLGTNPDGKYALEPYDDEKKFNLYKRVIQRVPECTHWLLKDWLPYIGRSCPDIDTSTEIFKRLSDEIGLCFVDRRALMGWQKIDPEGLKEAQTVSSAALVDCQLPEIVAFILSLLHLAVWQSAGISKMVEVVDLLENIFHQALDNFSKSPVFDYADDGRGIADQVEFIISTAPDVIRRWGMRSLSRVDDWRIPDVPHKLVLVECSEDTEAAMLTLHTSAVLMFNNTVCETGVVDPDLPTAADLAKACSTLLDSAIAVQDRIERRATDNLRTQ